jgi:hypothetical protein
MSRAPRSAGGRRWAIDLYHLERVVAAPDQPRMYACASSFSISPRPGFAKLEPLERLE